jgi:hypothetical protein
LTNLGIPQWFRENDAYSSIKQGLTPSLYESVNYANHIRIFATLVRLNRFNFVLDIKYLIQMAFQAEILLTRFFPIIAVIQAYFFFRTIWNKKSDSGAIHLYMALVILLILGTNSYALYQMNAAVDNGHTSFQEPMQLKANFYMTIFTTIGFLTLILVSKSKNHQKVEKGIALLIFIFTLINIGFSIQSFGNSFIQ